MKRVRKSSRRRIVTPTAIAAVATMLAGVEPAPADLIEWTAPGDGSFHQASNWTPGMVPGSSDLAGFGQSGTTSTITFNGDAQTLSLELSAGDYTFDLHGHTYAFVDIVAPINLVGTNGYSLTFIDGTVTSWRAAMFGTGAWTIGAGATVDLGNDLSMAGASNDLYVDGGVLTAQSARIADGASSSANVWLTGGGLLSVETFRVAHVAGSDGYLGVGGAGTRIEAVNLLIGTEGTGRFSVTEFAEAEIENVTFGGNGTAEVHVRDGGELKSTLDLCVGDGAVVEIGDLGLVDARGFGTDIQPGGHVDLQSGGTLRTGSIEVDGLFTWAPGSTLDIGSSLRVEPIGPLGDMVEVQERTLMVGGTLFIESNAGIALVDVDDGVLEAGSVIVAQQNGTFGHLRVRGATAGTATIEGELVLGTPSSLNGGSAELDVESGGSITIGGLLRVGSDCLVDVKPDSQLTVAQVFNDGNFDQQGGLVLIGGDLPPGVTSGFVLNRIGEEATFTNGTTAQLVTPGGAIGTGPGGSAALSAQGDWFCFGPLEIGRAGEPADAAQLLIDGLVSVTGDAVIHDSGLVDLRFPDSSLQAERLENHGRLIGTGDLHAEVINAGRVEVHRTGQTPSDLLPGVLRVIPSFAATESFEQTADGTLAIKMFAPGEYDRLHVNVPTQLGGTLEITLVDGFEPAHGALYEIITALDAPDAVITGTFDAIVPAEFEAVYTSHAMLIRRIDPCPADLDDSGHVGFDDLALLLGNWGPCPFVCPPRCQWDLDDSNHVGFNDLALLLGSWGTCP